MASDSSSIDWNVLSDILERHQHFVLTGHVRPDCDALGSELALAGLLQAMGKNVRIVNADATPPRLAFVDPHGQIEVLHQDVRPEELEQAEVIIVLDTGAWGQLGSMADVIRRTAAQVVVIDHHVNDGEIDAEVFQDAGAEATGRLVWDLSEFLQVPLTTDTATALFSAIATDTGWFRFPSTRSCTYRVAAKLIEAGALPHEIYRRLYECDSFSRAKLRSVALSRIVTELDGRLAHTYVRADDFQRTGAVRSETEDFINMVLAIEGTEVAVMFTEQPTGSVKVSFRSRTTFDCSRMAAAFHGGGHRAAAGATLEGSFEEIQARVIHAVLCAMQS